MSEEELVRRLEKLERDNRHLKGLGLGTVVLAVALGSIYATRPVPQLIRAHTFEVTDNAGRVRAKMTAPRSGGAAIVILGAQGRPRAVMSESGIGLSDAQGHPRAVISVTRSKDVGVSLSDAQGHARENMEVSASGEPGITLFGPHFLGATAWIAIDSSGSPAVSLSAADGNGHAGITVSESGVPSIGLRDAHGYSMDLGGTHTVAPATGQTQQTSAASIVMFGNDKDHHVIWQAP